MNFYDTLLHYTQPIHSCMNLISFDFRLDGQANGHDDYDAGDYDKEPQQKNDIHLAENEDEGEGNF